MSDARSDTPAEVPTAVLRAWDANLDVDLALAEHLTEAMMAAQTPGGGMRVDQHLGHVLGSTLGWGMDLETNESGPCHAALDTHGLWTGEAFRPLEVGEVAPTMRDVAAAARASAIASPSGSAALPHADAAAYLIHQLVHHAHHRGQILLALKTAGHPLPDEDAMWAPWRRDAPPSES